MLFRSPLLFGGAQQDKIRPGTENVAYIAALGQAVENSTKAITEQLPTIRALQELLLSELSSLPDIKINSVANGTPYITNISVEGIRSETLMHLLEEYNIYLSSGSACSKGAASHVLAAAGLSKGRIDSAIRISLGKHNTREDIIALIDAIKIAQARLVRKKTR